MENMGTIGQTLRAAERTDVPEILLITIRRTDAVLVLRHEPRKLRRENGGLNRLKPRIVTDRLVLVLDLLADVPKHPHFVAKRDVGSRDRSALAHRAQILAGIKA